MPFYQYLEEEKEALIQQGQDSEGEDYQNNSSDNEVSLAGQQGLELIGYSWDEIKYLFLDDEEMINDDMLKCDHCEKWIDVEDAISQGTHHSSEKWCPECVKGKQND